MMSFFGNCPFDRMADNVTRLPPKMFGRKLSDAELNEIRTVLEGMEIGEA